ncbi:hypothetical protein SpAn4DRAFT_0129 [Sporomusa ovata]|uniref:Uncharacterized protein n=1 Tax=Sporomusa ovata TaxID=2378 RepID=A0A0U1L1W3_9FIRM|nr:hypothetical protein SpAn4DRAFT_0129 [Sporomusa ovata]
MAAQQSCSKEYDKLLAALDNCCYLYRANLCKFRILTIPSVVDYLAFLHGRLVFVLAILSISQNLSAGKIVI